MLQSMSEHPGNRETEASASDQLLTTISRLRALMALPATGQGAGRTVEVQGEVLPNIMANIACLRSLSPPPSVQKISSPAVTAGHHRHDFPVVLTLTAAPLQAELEPRPSRANPAISEGALNKGLAVKVFELDPALTVKQTLIAASATNRAAVAYKLLRSQLLNQLTQSSATCLGITSPRPGDGKTTTSINLAWVLSGYLAQPVVLIDFDLHKPTLHQKLALPDCAPLTQFGDGQGYSLLQLRSTELYLLPGAVSDRRLDPDQLTQCFDGILATVRRRLPGCLVLVDLPPALAVDDACVLDAIEGFVLVVSESVTTRDELQDAIDLVSRERVLGYVLNKSHKGSRDQTYSGYYYPEATAGQPAPRAD